jgi:nitrilase
MKAAVIQKPPVLLDRDATISRMLELIEEATREGATLLVFPEAYIPGYPTWIWRLKPGGDMALSGELHARLRLNSVSIARGDLKPIQDSAKKHEITLIVGINEIDDEVSGTTLYNTVVIIGPDGTILNRHRKLMPTNPERMVWGMGDASGLKVVDTPAGRIGSLICWENYMPLARYALYAQGIDIYVAPTWDTGESWLATMRHIAKEAGCWVIGTSTAIHGNDLPKDFPDRDKLFQPDEWINDGDAVVIKPFGAIAAGPLHREKGILYSEIDAEAARRSRRSLDVAGHYSRPDVFSFSVDRRAKGPVTFED